MSEEEKEVIEDIIYWNRETKSYSNYIDIDMEDAKIFIKAVENLIKENEEYHRIKKDLIRVNKKIYDVDTIDEFIETIDKLQKVIDLMATELSRRPLMIYLDDERDDRLAILDNPKKIIKYYTKKAEE